MPITERVRSARKRRDERAESITLWQRTERTTSAPIQFRYVPKVDYPKSQFFDRPVSAQARLARLYPRAPQTMGRPYVVPWIGFTRAWSRYYTSSNWPSRRVTGHLPARTSRVAAGRSSVRSYDRPYERASARAYVRVLTKVVCRVAGAACTKLEPVTPQYRGRPMFERTFSHTLASHTLRWSGVTTGRTDACGMAHPFVAARAMPIGIKLHRLTKLYQVWNSERMVYVLWSCYRMPKR